MRFAALALTLLLIPVPARADWTPDADTIARVASGGIYAEVERDPQGASGVVHGSVEIDASPQAVWNTILDCGGAARMAPSVRTCKVTDRDPGGRWDVREMTVRWATLTPTFRTIFRSEFEPHRRIRFRCVGGDIRICEGQWRLEAIGPGRTRVIYENRASSPISAPAVITRTAMRRDVARALVALRTEAERRDGD